MKWYRVWAIVMRHLLQFPTDFNKLSTVFYWPVLDIILFGFTGSWLDADTPGLTENRFILLTGVVLWQIVIRAGYSISINLLEEIWAHNLTNLLSTPLSLGEWILAGIVEGLMMLILIVLCCFGVTYLFYGYNIFALGWWFIPIVSFVFFAGLSIGLIAGSLIAFWGNRVQAVAWMISWLVAPISGAFYPIGILPVWLQSVAKFYPLHYIFSCMREVLTVGSCSLTLLAQAFALTTVYVMLTLVLFVRMFNKSKESGLARISN